MEHIHSASHAFEVYLSSREVNCRNQAITLIFRVLSISFTLEAFVCNRKMSAIGIFRQVTLAGLQTQAPDL